MSCLTHPSSYRRNILLLRPLPTACPKRRMKVCQVFLTSDVSLSWPCFFLRALLSSTLPLIKYTLIKSLSSCTDLSYFLLFPKICFFISLLHHPSIPHILPHSHFPALVVFCPYVPSFYSYSSPTILLSLHPSAYPLLSTSLPRSLLLSITSSFPPTLHHFLHHSFTTPCHSFSISFTGVVGHFLVSLGFEEDVSGLFTGNSTQLRLVPEGPEEPMSMERLSVHISRFQSVQI